MRVGLLASLLSRRPGYRRAGVSRYIEALLTYVPRLAPDIELVASVPRSVWLEARDEFAGIAWQCTGWPTEHPIVRIAWEQGIAPWTTLRCDVVHGPVNVLPLALARPGIVTVHDVAFLHFPEHYPAAKRWYLRLMTGLSVRRARRVIAVSEQTQRDLVLAYGLAPHRVTVIPNGIDPDWTRVPEHDLARWRAERGLPERFLLFVGTIQPRKNLARLVEALARLGDQLDWPLYVVGARGWKENPVFRTVQETGLGDRIVFVGYVLPQELRYWYSAATIFVYPSLYEGFGLPVLEAMACGTPVITSDRSALPEVAGDAAVLVDPTDPAAIAAAIRELVRDEGRRLALAQAGRQRARTFSWERTAQETVRVYRSLACRHTMERGGCPR
ncbi:MAG: glycosyltransferase family 1 protein [Thermomicrobium sp.]|nr:glycosyltransferase family 1 protein [Thermomicrobium sp.]